MTLSIRVWGLSVPLGAFAAAIAISHSLQSPAYAGKAHAANSEAQALANAFSILRPGSRNSAASNPLPLSVARAQQGPSSIAGASEPDLAGGYVPGRYPTWVEPSGGSVCIAQTNAVDLIGAPAAEQRYIPDRVCVSSADTLAGLLYKKNSDVTTGLAPDGNSSVKVMEADGSMRLVPVVNNVYEIVGGSPRSVSLRDATGETITHEFGG